MGDAASDYEAGLRSFARWNGFLAAHPDPLLRVTSKADIERPHQTHRIGVLLTLQDSTHFRTPPDVDEFFGLGQRISQLTYNSNKRIGSGFLERRDGGLSVFGLSIMKRMEKVGMAVDVSHCGDQTTLGALEASYETGPLHACHVPGTHPKPHRPKPTKPFFEDRVTDIKSRFLRVAYQGFGGGALHFPMVTAKQSLAAVGDTRGIWIWRFHKSFRRKWRTCPGGKPSNWPKITYPRFW